MDAKTVVSAIEAYAGVGLVVAVAFVVLGMGRVVAGAKGTGPLFRAMMVPGAVVLWPVVLVRWAALARRRASSPAEAHGVGEGAAR